MLDSKDHQVAKNNKQKVDEKLDTNSVKEEETFHPFVIVSPEHLDNELSSFVDEVGRVQVDVDTLPILIDELQDGLCQKKNRINIYELLSMFVHTYSEVSNRLHILQATNQITLMSSVFYLLSQISVLDSRCNKSHHGKEEFVYESMDNSALKDVLKTLSFTSMNDISRKQSRLSAQFCNSCMQLFVPIEEMSERRVNEIIAEPVGKLKVIREVIAFSPIGKLLTAISSHRDRLCQVIFAHSETPLHVLDIRNFTSVDVSNVIGAASKVFPEDVHAKVVSLSTCRERKRVFPHVFNNCIVRVMFSFLTSSLTVWSTKQCFV